MSKEVEETAEKILGTVTHYYNQANAAVVKLAKGASLKKGDQVHIRGETTDFTQMVDSLQIDHKDVEAVKAGDDFGIKVKKVVREGDIIYGV